MLKNIIPLLIYILITSCAVETQNILPTLDQGPYLGHVDDESAIVWTRMSDPGAFQLHLNGNGSTNIYEANVDASSDLCTAWKLNGLSDKTSYSYFFTDLKGNKLDSIDYKLVTDPKPEVKNAVSMALVSCVDDEHSSNFSFWEDVEQKDPDLLILLGDTPYIDSTGLQYQFQRYREFNEVPQYDRLLKKVPFYGTWDDHDFGLNDTDGNLEGKENARLAFQTYRPNPTFGDGNEGIYTRFRKGPVEFFLLDTRWFAGTESSPANSDSLTLLGKKQWDWLIEGLKASTADFKVLACGMIWNGATRPNKPDHWGAYQYERDSLFSFIGKNKIEGVVLVGGDIHRSRLIRHDVQELSGYGIYEIISSPMHTGVIESANAPHPGLIFDMGLGGAYVMMDVDNTEDPAILKARFLTSDGKQHHQFEITAAQLKQL